MAKKKSNRYIHISRQKRILASILKINHVKKQQSIVVEKSQIQGYINVCVITQRNKVGEICALNMIKTKKKKSSSIRLFIAGGKDIDDKVARANAALRTKGGII